MNVHQLGSLCPWDNLGKCHTVGKRIQCLSNTLQHVPIYLQPFLRYSKLLVENCDIFTPHLCLAPAPVEFREDLDTHKTRINGLSCGEEIMTIHSAVLIQYQRVTVRRPAYIRASAQLTHVKIKRKPGRMALKLACVLIYFYFFCKKPSFPVCHISVCSQPWLARMLAFNQYVLKKTIDIAVSIGILR